MYTKTTHLMAAATISLSAACTLGSTAELESANALDFDPALCEGVANTGTATVRVEPVFHGELNHLGLLTQREHYQLRILACADASSLTRAGHINVRLLDQGDDPFRVFRYSIPAADASSPDGHYAYFSTDVAASPQSLGDVIWGNDALRTHKVEVSLTSTNEADVLPAPASNSVQPPPFDFELCSPSNPTEMHVWMDDWRSIKARGCHVAPAGSTAPTTLELQAIDNDAGSQPQTLWRHTEPSSSRWLETWAVEAVRFKVDGSGDVVDEDQHIRRIQLLVNGVVEQTFEVCRYSTDVIGVGCLFEPNMHPCFGGHEPSPLEMECKVSEAAELGVEYPY